MPQTISSLQEFAPSWLVNASQQKSVETRCNPGFFCIFQTCLALKRAFQPGTKYVFFTFSGGKGRSLVRSLCTPWEALHNKNLRIQTCLRGWYQVRFFGLIFGHSWGNGEGPGWHLVRYLCETRKALHERHVWKTLSFDNPTTLTIDHNVNFRTVD